MSDPLVATFVAVCKLAYVPISGDNDEVIPSNVGALRLGFDALQKEDVQDFARAEQLWQKGQLLLANEVTDDTGAGAQGVVQVEDDFQMSMVTGDGGYW